MNINISNDRAAGLYGGNDTAAVSGNGHTANYSGGIRSGLEDRFSETSTVSNINSRLSALDVSHASRLTKLATSYASGRYQIDSTELAKSVVAAAVDAK